MTDIISGGMPEWFIPMICTVPPAVIFLYFYCRGVSLEFKHLRQKAKSDRDDLAARRKDRYEEAIKTLVGEDLEKALLASRELYQQELSDLEECEYKHLFR